MEPINLIDETFKQLILDSPELMACYRAGLRIDCIVEKQKDKTIIVAKTRKPVGFRRNEAGEIVEVFTLA